MKMNKQRCKCCGRRFQITVGNTRKVKTDIGYKGGLQIDYLSKCTNCGVENEVKNLPLSLTIGLLFKK